MTFSFYTPDSLAEFQFYECIYTYNFYMIQYLKTYKFWHSFTFAPLFTDTNAF